MYWQSVKRKSIALAVLAVVLGVLCILPFATKTANAVTDEQNSVQGETEESLQVGVSSHQAVVCTYHNYNVSAATCTVQKYCKTCGYVAQKALGHSTVYKVTKDPTCTTQGTYVYTCTRAGCKYSTGNYIPSLGHNPGAAATCTSAQTCKRCSTVLQKALGHNPGAAATCTSAQTCKRCSTVLQKALGHNTTYSVTKQPTCTERGTFVYKCTRCAYSTGDYISALGHDPGAAATCTTAQTCKRCAAVIKNALGHDPGAAATCTTAQTCKRCAAVVRSALGHNPGAAATCTTAQRRAHVCTVQ